MFDTMNRNKEFAEAFSRGKEGELSNYKAWLEKESINNENLSRETMLNYYGEHPEKITDRKEALNKIGEYSGYLEEKGDKHHISIHGVSGSGKTQLLKVASSLINGMSKGLEVEYIDAENFQNQHEESTEFERQLSNLSQKDKAIVMIDNIDNDKRSVFSVSEIKSALENCLILTTWSPQTWSVKREEVENEIGVSDEVYLETFSKSQTEQVISSIIDEIMGRDIEISSESEELLTKYSRGIPEVVRKILLKSLKESFLNGYEVFSEDSIESAASEMNLVSAPEVVRDLTDAQKVILKNILLSVDKRGVQPKELKKRIERDKSTISYHLTQLKSEKILDSQKKGRSVFYTINEDIKPILQLQMKEEGIYG